MRDLILFSIDKNHFALGLENIKRIVQATATTPVAGNAKEIEGVFTFENNVLNVLDFRTMIGVESFSARYDELFTSLGQKHNALVEGLTTAIDNDQEFEQSLSPYDCALGKWLGSFQAYDDYIIDLVNKLSSVHTKFHLHAADAYNQSKIDKEAAQHIVQSKVLPLKEELMGYINTLKDDKDLIANSMQKFLIIDAQKSFAVRIDEVDDIIAISEDDIQSSESFDDEDSLVKIDGIFEYKENLVNLIDNIRMPAAKE